MSLLQEFPLLLLEFLLFLVIPGWCVLALIRRFRLLEHHSESLRICLSMGVGPALLALFLYYLLLLLPSLAAGWYLLLLFVFPASLLFINRAYISPVAIPIPQILPVSWRWRRFSINHFLFFSYLLFWLVFVLINPIADHDFFEYAIQGKIFARDRFISYSTLRFDASSDFAYVGLHGFSFPLLATAQDLLMHSLGLSSDAFFKSITGYYWMLLLCLVFFYLEPFSKAAAKLFLLMMVMTYGYYTGFFVYHIDTMRMFLIAASTLAWLSLIQKHSIPGLYLFALLCASMAFVHSLGFFLAAIQIAGLVFFIRPFNTFSIKHWSIFVLIFLLGGPLHYLIDTLYGTGWIFKEIKYY